MKKSLLLAALALFGAAAQANAALNIEEGKPYVLRYGTSDFYFNMEKDGIGDGSSKHNASLSANATTVYFHQNPATPGQWAICYSAEDASKCLGVGGQNGVSGAYWNAVINCSDPFYWSLTENSTAASGNPVVRINKTNDATHYLAINSNDAIAEGTPTYSNKDNNDGANWELIPVAMPDGINLDPTKAYLMSLKGHDGLNLQMLAPKNETHVTISESIVAPVRIVPKHDGKVAIVCCQTGLFLGYSRWNSIYNSAAAASWTIAATEDAGETYYSLHQNGSDAGYLGCSVANCANDAEIWTNVANNADELINWKFTEMTLTPVALTVNYTFDGATTYSSTVINGFDGASYSIDEFPPFTTGYTNPVIGTVNSQLTSIPIPVQMSVPFKYTATTDNMIWQGVTVHSNNDWFLKYTEDGSTTLVDKTANRKNLNSPFADSELWAFVGNLTDGFKIYNKAAGTEKTLYKDGNNAKVGAVTENNQWKLMVSDAIPNTSEACGFNIDNSNPMNAQGDALVFDWSLVDAGSTWEFYSLAEPMVNFYNQKGLATAPKLGCVGDLLPGTDLTEVDAAKAAAEEDPYNSEKAQALHVALNTVMESYVEFDPAKCYRLANVSNPNTYLVAGRDDNRKIWGGETSERTNHYSIVKFEAVPEQTDRYYIADQGLYFGHATGDTNTGNLVMQVEATATEGRGEFTISSMGAAKHVLRDAASPSDANRTYLHYTTDGIKGWGPYADASQWYIHPANDLDMTLSMDFDGKKIGTGYFPFPVKATGSAKLYYVTESKSKADNSPVMTYNEVSSVPAATAFIVMSESDDVTLAIDYDGISTLAEPENKLAGTYRAATATAGDYVFTGTAFEKSTDAPAISGNSAYVPQNAVSDSTVESYPFVNPDMTTGINEIGVATSGKQVIYDLQGRRVQRATKGLYIINGVKTLVK